jgi:hypothetical protein
MSTQVTINDVIPKTQITATAGQTVFTTNWTANAASDVVVYARTSAQTPDDLTQLVSSANYTVAFVGGSEIVEVTFLVGRALNDVITITRDTPADRLNLYTNTNFTPSMLNQDVGILTLVDQQAQLYNQQVAPHYNVSATPNLGSSITGLGGDIYLPILGANEGWKKNSANTEIVPITFPSSGGLGPSDATYIVQTPWNPGSELPNSQALSPLATGFMTSVTATGVVSTRTLQGTANQIDVTNGTGTGNPVFSLSSALQLPGTMTFGGNVDANGFNISNIGVITGGTWQGNTIGVAYGGTGNTTVGANGTLAQSDGTKYTFTTATYPSTATATGTILRADGTNWVATTATYPATTTINQILYSSANNVIGGITTANSATLVTSSTGVPAFTGSMTNGQLVIGSTGATPVVGSITGAGSITVTPGAGTIQISSSAGGVVNPGTANELAYYATTGSAVSGLATANNGVLITSAGGVPSISSTLPTAVQGNITSVGTIASGTWQGTTIAIGYGGTGATTIGANGTLAQSNGSIYTFTTATYPSTTTANRLLYSSATNTVTDLATANSATLVTNASGVPAWTSSMTNGQILIGSTGATPVVGTITGTSGISVAVGAGTITLSGTGSGIGWNEITGASQIMAPDQGYVTNNAGLVTLTLPAVAAFGTVINIVGKGAGGWRIAQGAGQQIQVGSTASTVGAGGYVESTNRYDSIELLCTTANTTWTCLGGPQGAITVA